MRKQLSRFWRDNKALVLFIVLMVVFRSSIADWNTVPTGSMKPTILEGDRILVDKLAYDLNIPLTHWSLMTFGDPERGDIVIFDSEAAGDRLVKRVVGVPGDVVTLEKNRLFINGAPARYTDISYGTDSVYAVESYGRFSHRVKADLRPGLYSSFGPVAVPEGHYFVLGDNRDNSRDSRFIGLISREEIVGRSEKVVISLNYDNYYLPRVGRFFHEL